MSVVRIRRALVITTTVGEGIAGDPVRHIETVLEEDSLSRIAVIDSWREEIVRKSSKIDRKPTPIGAEGGT